MGNKICEFSLQAQSRRLDGIDCGYLVQEVCQPHELGVVLHVEAPDSVVDNLVADVDLFGLGFLGEVHDSGSEVEIFVELIVEIKAQQGFALHGVERLIFQCHIDALPGVNDALVGNGHNAHCVVYRIVAVFHKRDTAGSDYYRSARHIHGIKPDLRGRAFGPLVSA